MRTHIATVGRSGFLAALLFGVGVAPGSAQITDYRGRWVPKELVGTDGREITDSTQQIRTPLRPPTNGQLNDREQRQYGILVGMGQPSRSIEFNPTDSTFTVHYNDEFSFTLVPGSEPLQTTFGDDVPMLVQARWNGEKLRIQFEPQGGGSYYEEYSLADSRLFMRVDAKINWGKIRGGEWSEMYRRVADSTSTGSS